MLLDSLVNDPVFTEDDFLRVSRIVYDHCGINLGQGKKELVRARLAKRLRANKIQNFSEYIDYALNDPTGVEFSLLIDSLCTNLTGFFREYKHFEFLQQSYIPALMEHKCKAGNYKIRAWSAGCSSGEEPYSLAITLLDGFAGKGNWDIKVLGTDISKTMLERAKQGTYNQKRIESVSLNHRHKYLKINRTNEKVYEVNDFLRGAVIFRYLNLMGQWPIRGPLDFIFCRNVMIYFDNQKQQQLIDRFYNILDKGGLLFTGHSESLTGIVHKFRYIQPTIYAKL